MFYFVQINSWVASIKSCYAFPCSLKYLYLLVTITGKTKEEAQQEYITKVTQLQEA
jgi:hypothetical protein